MVILVTGGAGYIGSHIVSELKKANYKPIVFDSLELGHEDSIGNTKLFRGNLDDSNILEKIFMENKIEAVIHLAAYSISSDSVKEPVKYYRNNVLGTLNLLKIMQQHQVKKIIYSSSAAVYGTQARMPLNEEHPINPINPYGGSKFAAEKILDFCNKLLGIRYVSLRYFNAAGADPDGKIGEDHDPETHLIPCVIKSALSNKSINIYGGDYNTDDGTCVRDYIHVSDLADAHILALNHLNSGGNSNIYNVGTGKGHSVKEIISLCEQELGIKIKTIITNRRLNDPPSLIADPTKIKKELNWKPKFENIGTIIKHSVNWIKNQPQGYLK
jgi:UDP-glucose 4-epimerase